jgi:lipopolysaccharide/colanic/teichoic acid biosynthesis glycosyltransferase
MSSRPLETKERPPRETVKRSYFPVRSRQLVDSKIAPEELFIKMIRTERKRAERSRKPFLLMLFDISQFSETEKGKIVEIVLSSLRETDITGWYESGHITGVIFTEIGPMQPTEIQSAIFARLTAALQLHFDPEKLKEIQVSFHIFPEEWGGENPQRPVPPELYVDLSQQNRSKKFSLIVKRAMDVVGSSVGLIGFSPVFLAIALAVKLSSKGPVLFRQERVGQFGKTFICLKFRSMARDCDPSIHQEFVSHFIAGKADDKSIQTAESPFYKLTEDTRITLLGRFLRKSSLDEMPQFWNVLKGEMSLVGPRPPIPYELKSYDLWHRRRVLEAKPGLTGLWQVTGRSKTRFDDMVRLDLRYACSRSLWVDIKILLRTPIAVLMGGGGC